MPPPPDIAAEAKAEAQLIVVFPPPGASRAAAAEFVGRCILYGLDLYFEAGDVLPARVPRDLTGVRAIVLERNSGGAAADAEALESYRRRGARVYLLEPELPDGAANLTRTWRVGHLLDMIALDAGLTLHHPRQRERMLGRDEHALFAAMTDRLLQSEDIRWYDATRYNWEALLDVFELTGEQRWLDHALAQMRAAMRQDNPLDNCDTIAPFLPMLRAYEHVQDRALLDFARTHVERYLAQTPRYRGCLVNFNWLPHCARAEVVWQVCPALAYLTRVCGDGRYIDAALEQVERLDDVLSDDAMPFWRHGVGDGVSATPLWSRCVAFVLLALVHLSELTPAADPRNPRKRRLADRLVAMAAAARQAQRRDGFWSLVLDSPDSQAESSGTAWLAAALERAMRTGLLDAGYRPAANAAWDAVRSRLCRGRLVGHNVATTSSPSRSYYVKRPLHPLGWTHFALRAACERRRTLMS